MASPHMIMLAILALTCSIALASDPMFVSGSSPMTSSLVGFKDPVGSRVTAGNVGPIEASILLESPSPALTPTHPRAAEIWTLLEGTLEVGFTTSNQENRLIKKVLQKGDVFVFPVGRVHFQRNTGYGKAVAIAALSSQNAGVVTVANAVFGSNPDISADILAKAFQVD